MSESERRRRRPPVSCILCRRRKIRCNRQLPCSNCVRSKTGDCTYDDDPRVPPPPPRRRASSTESATAAEAAAAAAEPVVEVVDTYHWAGSSSWSAPSVPASSAATPATTATSGPSEASQARRRQLEAQTAANEPSQEPADQPSIEATSIQTHNSAIAGTFHLHHRGGREKGQEVATVRTIAHKTRVFGQSHWMNGIVFFRDLMEQLDPYLQDPSCRLVPGVLRAKALARTIKTQRLPVWPAPLTYELPTRELADELVERYIRISESLYRVLHIPSFRRDYEALWTPGGEPPERAFMVQAKLVFAIGAAAYDESFSLRPSAMLWLYQAMTWQSEPEFKSRLSLQALQNQALVLRARHLVGVGRDLVWIDDGGLLRSAIYMGLHIDPSRMARKPLIVSEMRRRLWASILELTLQSAMLVGQPPLLGPRDFNTEAPANYNDDDLTADPAPEPRPASEFTESSVAIALRRSFVLRLRVTSFLNDVGAAGVYAETLRLDRELRAAHKATRAFLHHPPAPGDASGQLAPSQFQLRSIDFLLHRYLSAIHIPYFAIATTDATYAYSRKVTIDLSLKVWRSLYPEHPPGSLTVDTHDYFSLMTVSGSGSFRNIAFQASFLITIELKTQLDEDDSLYAAPLRPDLLAVLHESHAWSQHYLQLGETNVKGYMLSALLVAQIDGLMRRLPPEQLWPTVIRLAEEAVDEGITILEPMAAQAQAQARGADAEPDASVLRISDEVIDNWNLNIAEALFGFVPDMGDGFGDAPMQGLDFV